MSKQEEIRKGLERFYEAGNLTPVNVLFFLEKKGVVIKVNRGLPYPSEEMNQRLVSPVPLMSPYHGSVIEAYRLAQQDMGEAGWEAVEPLVKNGL